MKKILTIAFLFLLFTACDKRPPGGYDAGEVHSPVDVERVEYNGITYLKLDEQHSEDDGWVVDYSQFFVEDTLIINGQVWVRQGAEEEVKKHQRVPEKEDGDG